MKQLFWARNIVCFTLLFSEIQDLHAINQEQEKLQLSNAYQYVLENSWRIKAGQAEIGMREADKIQAGLYPNPALSFGIDELRTSNQWDDNEISVGITQLFLLGGKRAARQRAADAAIVETNWSLELLKCDLYIELLHAFIDVAAAQEHLLLAQNLKRISELSQDCVNCKSELGKASAVDINRSQLTLYGAKALEIKKQAEYQSARIRLASLWNCENPQFKEVDFSLFDLAPPPPFEALAEELCENPELSRVHAELCKAWEMIQVEESERVPDVAVYMGFSSERFFQQPGVSIGVTIPLPIFDRNQGNIARASHEHNQVLFKQADIIAKLRTRLAVLHKEWKMAYAQAESYKDMLDTMAQEGYELSKAGYELGNSEYLELLGAQITLFNIRQQYLDAVIECQHKRADVLKLISQQCQEKGS